MRTTLNIPEEIINEAKKLLGYTSKTDVIIFCLRELIRRKRIEKLKELSGTIQLNVDINKARRRKRA